MPLRGACWVPVASNVSCFHMKQAPVESVVQLLQYCESFAKQMLATSGEFYPFGAFVDLEGRVEVMGAHLGSEHPNPQELFSFLQGALAQMGKEEKLLAYGIAANVDIPKEYSPPFPDGIRVHVVAPDVCHRYIYTPYRLRSYRKLLKFLGFVPTEQYAESIVVDL